MKRTNRIKKSLKRQLWQAAILGPMLFVMVAGAGCPSFFESPVQRATKIRQAVEGRDGAKTITLANTVVNAYTRLAGANLAVGATTLTVAAIADLTATFTGALAQGDLLLIVQMAGATIDATNTTAYGSVTALSNAGHYEFAGVEAVNGNVITLACALKNAYTVAGKTQVIRVPQYTTLTIATGASITATPWNGTIGGVVALHAETTLQLNGGIDASAKGFRGGASHNSNGAIGAAPVQFSANDAIAAQKGESIAGYGAEILGGQYGRGAPANGGGGGDTHNGGGGGGANARSGATWTGQGVMRNTVVGAVAWELDPGYIANTNALTNSEGGGRGGYSWSNTDQNALTVGPGDARWQGDNRRDVGGLGGHPLDNNLAAATPNARLFMGGGGGAGDGNNGVAGPGGRGGGLIFIIAGIVAGNGTIRADGEAGGDTSGATGASSDAAGGGGGGGTVVVHAASITGTPTISANGGVGGNQTASAGNEAEGPGGGGGGGYIAVSGGTPTRTATGGLGGTTNRPVLTEFPSDGATAGNAGQTNGDATTFLYCGTTTPPKTTILNHPLNPTDSSTADFTFQATEAVPGGGTVDITSSVTFRCKLDTGAWGACNASHTITGVTEGSHTLNVQAIDLSGNADITGDSYTWVYASKLDAAPAVPDTVIVLRPDSTSTSATGTFTFQAVRGATDVTSSASFECKLDIAVVWSLCLYTGYTTPVLDNGQHTLSVRATDANGTDQTPAIFTWNVAVPRLDAGTPPVTIIVTHPTDPSTTAGGTFTFQAIAGGIDVTGTATFQCKLDNAADFAPCPATYTISGLLDGPHSLVVRSTAGGLTDPTGARFGWTVAANPVKLDASLVAPPTTVIVTRPTDPSTSDAGTFTFKATEIISGSDAPTDVAATFKCKLDLAEWADCTATYTTPALADGPHTITVRATDASGNQDPTGATFTWTVRANASNLDGGASNLDGGAIDATLRPPPKTVIDDNPTNPSPSSTGTFTFHAIEGISGLDASATVPGATFECNLDNAGWVACKNPYITIPLKDGPHTLSVRATDPSGNKENTGVTYKWTVATKLDGGSVDGKDASREDVALVPLPEPEPGFPQIELRGGGFCSIGPAGTTSPVAFVGLALVAMAALLRRRRR